MSLQHINIKIFVAGELTVNLEDVIKLFHRWVGEQSLPEMMIDVADYRHVPEGPSVVLVGHEAHYVLDEAQGSPGLLYNRRAPLDGTDEDRIAQAFYAAGSVCERLSAEFPAFKFDRTRFEVIVNDRGSATVGPDGQAALQAAISHFVTNSLGQTNFTCDFQTDPRRRAGALVQLSQPIELSPVTA